MYQSTLKLTAGAFDSHSCAELTKQATAIATNNALSGAFSGSYGFQRVFRRDGITELLTKHAFLSEFLEAAMAHDFTNAFYLNALIVNNGGAVQQHRDCSLNGWLGFDCAPLEVSVLYVQVPADLAGGRLQLFDEHGLVATCSPREGSLLHFDGKLAHEVTATSGSVPRVSLVLEQYQVESDILGRVPKYSETPDGYETLERVAEKWNEFARGLSAEELQELLSLEGEQQTPGAPGCPQHNPGVGR